MGWKEIGRFKEWLDWKVGWVEQVVQRIIRVGYQDRQQGIYWGYNQNTMMNPLSDRESKFGRLSQIIQNHNHYSSISLQLNSNPALLANPLQPLSVNPHPNLPTNPPHQTTKPCTKIKRKLNVPTIKINKQNNKPQYSNINSSRMIQSVIMESDRETPSGLDRIERVREGRETVKETGDNMKQKVAIKEVFKKKSPGMLLSVAEKAPRSKQDIHHLFTIKRNNNSSDEEPATQGNKLRGINSAILKLQQTIQEKQKHNREYPRRNTQGMEIGEVQSKQEGDSSMFRFNLFPEVEEKIGEIGEIGGRVEKGCGWRPRDQNVSLSLSFGLDLGCYKKQLDDGELDLVVDIL